MSDVHIAGTGIWFPEDIITNDEIVSSFNFHLNSDLKILMESYLQIIFNKSKFKSFHCYILY